MKDNEIIPDICPMTLYRANQLFDVHTVVIQRGNVFDCRLWPIRWRNTSISPFYLVVIYTYPFPEARQVLSIYTIWNILGTYSVVKNKPWVSNTGKKVCSPSMKKCPGGGCQNYGDPERRKTCQHWTNNKRDVPSRFQACNYVAICLAMEQMKRLTVGRWWLSR